LCAAGFFDPARCDPKRNYGLGCKSILTAEGTTFVNGGSGSSGFYQLSLAGASHEVVTDLGDIICESVH
jgi:hypothetical protein